MQVGVEEAEDVNLVEHVPVEVADDPVEIVPPLAQRRGTRSPSRTAIMISISGMPSISSVVRTREVV